MIEQGYDTREMFTLKQVREKAERGEITMSQALSMAYDNGIWDLEKMCVNKSRKMSTVTDHTYYKAVGTREIHRCVEMLRNPESMNVLQKPYTMQELLKLRNDTNHVTGCVSVLLNDIIDRDYEQFLDLLAVKLVNNECLMDISYNAVKLERDDAGDVSIIMKVTGDVSEILDMEEEET